jgi:galactose mutarotase-like enzyme
MIILENTALKVELSGLGAELHSVFSGRYSLEYLWNGNKETWPRHAPHLFPVVGKLKDNQFIYGGKKYTLPQHGFARDKEFQLKHVAENSVTFVLTDSPQTLQIYPFHFSLEIKYTLLENTLSVHYSVTNTGEGELYYSLGAHPGFSTRLGDAGNFEDFFLEFEKEENTERYFVEAGLVGNAKRVVFTTKKKLFLHKEDFLNDAWVFKNLESHAVSLRNTKNEHGLTLQWDPRFSFFGIWTKPGAEEFVCLEPWAGIADGINASGRLEEKEGILRLPRGEKAEFDLVMRFF